MTAEQAPRVNLSFTVDRDLHRRFASLAKAEERTVSGLLRFLMRRAVNSSDFRPRTPIDNRLTLPKE